MKLTLKESHVLNALLEQQILSEEKEVQRHVRNLQVTAKEYQEFVKTQIIKPHQEQIKLLRSIKEKNQK